MANGTNLIEGVSVPYAPPQVHAAVKAQTSKTWMLWSPNFLFANDNDLTQLHGGWDLSQSTNHPLRCDRYTPYWPGKAFVEYVPCRTTFCR
jgi:hypothetical protein